MRRFCVLTKVLFVVMIYLVIIFSSHQKVSAQIPSINEIRYRFEIEQLIAASKTAILDKYSGREDSNPQQYILTWTYYWQDAPESDPFQGFIRIYLNYVPSMNTTRSIWLENEGTYSMHTVDGWPVAQKTEHTYLAYKERYGITVDIDDDDYSTNEARQIADKIFRSMLPKIPDPGGDSAGEREDVPESRGYDQKTSSRDSEEQLSYRERKKRENLARLERERQEAIRKAKEEWAEIKARTSKARNKAAAAASEIRAQGKKIAELEGNSVAGSIHFSFPERRIPIFQERDHYIGIGILNGSAHEIRNVTVSLYAQTRKGRKQLEKSKVDFIRAGAEGSASLHIPHKRLYKLVDSMSSTDLVVTAEYNIVWSKAYKNKETKEGTWTNALNPRQDASLSEAEQAALKPPQLNAKLVNGQGQPLEQEKVVAGKNYFIRFSIVPDQSGSCLAAYSEPKWDPRPRDIQYSSWLDILDSRPPLDLADNMDTFNRDNNPRFSGELYSPGVQFYARFTAPQQKKEEDFQVILPIHFSSDLHLADQEEYWDEASKTLSFEIAATEDASRDLSDLLNIRVTELSRETDQPAVFILPGGRIGQFRGTIVRVQPTGRGWLRDIDDWHERNTALEEMDLTDRVEVEGEKQLAADVLSAQSQALGDVLSFAFSTKGIVEAESEAEVLEETGKAIMSLTVPGVGIIMPLLEAGKEFYKREGIENKLLKTLNLKNQDKPFNKGTMYTSPDQYYGDRVFFKVIDGTMYAIVLGETSM